MVRLRSTDYLQLAEVQVYASAAPLPPPPTATNLALGKPTIQSSTYDPSCSDAGKAVDGNTNGDYYACSVAHTSYDSQPWWQVDLQSVYSISQIVLWNRTDGYGARLANFDVRVSNDGVSWADFY